MKLQNKFILFSSLVMLFMVMLAALLFSDLRRSAKAADEIQALLDVRRDVLSIALFADRLLSARQRRGDINADELTLIVGDLIKQVDNRITVLMGQPGDDGFPNAGSTELRAHYELISELWPFYREAVSRVVTNRASAQNLAFVQENSFELANRITAAGGQQQHELARVGVRIQRFAATMVILLLATIVGSLYVIHFRFIRPVAALAEHLNAIMGAATPFQAVLPHEGASEIGTLARLFNRFIEQMREADQTKDRFLANMSHEIRTPLNGIVGFLENLADTPLNSQQTQYVRVIQSSARALLKVINDVLDFSKISAGRMELESVAFDMEALAGEVVAVTRELGKRRKLSVTFDYRNEGSSIVRGDPTRLRQILSNLMTNAVKFTERGSVALEVAFERPEEGDSEAGITFVVSDTGVGMTSEQQRRLFVPFTQANSSTTRKHGGTGLGLCIAANLVSLMGGQLRAESKPNVGSRFWFRIALPAAPSEEQVRLTEHYNIKFPPGAFKNYLILVVDDNATNLFLMETICQSIGLPYVTATNGKDAVEKAQKFHFDLIFMDIQMPVMDGYTAIREIRRSAPAATTQIIALTASAMQEDVEKALGAGSTGFLGKPFERNQLLLCITEHLGIPFERILKPTTETNEGHYETVVRNMYDFMREQYQISLGEIKLILAQTVANWRPEVADVMVFAKKGQWDSVRRIMHTLKGQLGAIGLPDYAEAADSVNSRIKVDDTADLMPTLDGLVTDLSGVFSYIEQNTAVDAQGRPLE